MRGCRSSWQINPYSCRKGTDHIDRYDCICCQKIIIHAWNGLEDADESELCHCINQSDHCDIGACDSSYKEI